MKQFFQVLMVVLFVVTAPAKAIDYQHPSITFTQSELDFLKEKIRAKESPWIDSWNKFCELSAASNTYSYSTRTTIGGSDGTRQRAYADAQAAYYNALRWYMTGQTVYAQHSADILNAWSKAITQPISGELHQLSSGEFVVAADILRLWSGWKADDQARFENMLINYVYPVERDARGGAGSWPGWASPANRSCLYIGMYLEVDSIVEDAVEHHRTSPGGGGILGAIYKGVQPVEMGRDQPHTSLGLNSLADICLAAKHLGIDLYSEGDNALMKGEEYYCTFNMNQSVEWEPINYGGHKFYYPAPSSNNPGSMPNNRIITNDNILRYYTEEKGLEMPCLEQMTRLYGISSTSWMHIREASRDVYSGLEAPNVPTGLRLTPGLHRITLDWDCPANFDASGYVIQRSSTSGTDGFSELKSWSNNLSITWSDTTVVPGQQYWYRVAAKNRLGTSDFCEAVSATPDAGSQVLPAGWMQADLSKEDWMVDGTTYYNPVNGGTFVVTGSGRDIYRSDHPMGNLTATQVEGDFTLIVRLADAEQEGDQQKEKFGIGVFENISNTSPRMLYYIGGNGSRYSTMDWRYVTGVGNGSMSGSDHSWTPHYVRVTREGNVFTCSVSIDGVAWNEVASKTLPLKQNVYVGPWVLGGEYRPKGFTVTYDHLTLEHQTSAPTLPSTLKATVANSTQITLSWSRPDGVSSFELSRSLTEDGPYEVIMSGRNILAYSDANLEPSTTYYYRLRTANACGWSTEYVTASATTSELNLPAAPTALTATALNNRVKLTWTATLQQTQGYIVRRRVGTSGDYMLLDSCQTNSYTDLTAMNDTSYYYRVSAYNILGEGAAKTSSKVTPSLGELYYFPFNESEGTISHDAWSNKTITAAGSSPSWSTGKYNKCVWLRSTGSDYVNLPDGITSNLTTCTVSAWVKPISIDKQARLWDFGTGTSSYMCLTINNGSNIPKFMYSHNGNSVSITSNGSLSTGAWTHVAVTVDENMVATLYINGSYKGKVTLPSTPAAFTSTQQYLGKSQYSGDSYLNGYIDEVRIYQTALDADQVKQLSRMKVQRIKCDDLPVKYVGDEDFEHGAEATSGLPLAITSSTPSVASLVTSTGLIHVKKAGETIFTFNQNAKGSLDYAAAASIERPLTVLPAEDRPDAVEEIEQDNHNDAPIYNLRGVRVTNPKRGIFIRDGHKIYIK